jgi:hypothetical protein
MTSCDDAVIRKMFAILGMNKENIVAFKEEARIENEARRRLNVFKKNYVPYHDDSIVDPKPTSKPTPKPKILSKELECKGKQVVFDGLVRSHQILNNSEKALKELIDSHIHSKPSIQHSTDSKKTIDIEKKIKIMGVKARIRRIENDILVELKALDVIMRHNSSLPSSLRDSNACLIDSIKDTIADYQNLLDEKYKILIELSD